jgi:hypothetical protein
LALVKHYENEVLSLNYEEALHFLINHIIKQGFFQNYNYDHLIHMTKSLGLKSGLVSNLENEYFQEIRVKENEETKKVILKKLQAEKENLINI